MLAPWVFNLLVFEHDQRAGNALAGFVRLDDVVNEATGTGHKGVGKAGFVFGFLGGQLFGIALVFAEDDSTAPLAPITAISALGQEKFTSPRRCLEAITS